MTKTLEHRGSADEIDDKIRRELATADAAANATGQTFRDSMRKVSEIQAAEIDRLRAVIAEYSKARPRVPVALAPFRRDIAGSQTGQPNDHILAICNDGTLWQYAASYKDSTWTPFPEIPQISDELEK